MQALSHSGSSSLAEFTGLYNAPFAQQLSSPSVFTSPPERFPSDVLAESSTPRPSRKTKADTVKRAVRARTGCITCRLRKKRCDEAKPACETCARLGIQCMGYGKKRPDWMKDEQNLKRMRGEIREKVNAQRAARPKKKRRTLDGKVDTSDSDDEQTDGEDREGSGGGAGEMYNVDEQAGTVDTAATLAALGQVPQEAIWTNGDLNGFIQGDSFSNILPESLGQMAPPSAFHSHGLKPIPLEPDMWDINTLIPTFNPSTSFITQLNDVSFFPDLTLPIGDTTSPAVPDNADLDEMWKMLFTSRSPSAQPSPTLLSLDPFPPLPEINALTSMPNNALSNMGYIHHYLNVVLPLQFRMGKSIAIGALVAPLAFQKSEVLTSISSLAALHLSSQRNGTLGEEVPLTSFNRLFPTNVAGDTDAIIARTSHRDVIDRLRFISSEHLASEDVIVPALFAVSYYLFMGGTSSQWREVIAMVQKCLFAALAASPDLTGEYSSYRPTGKKTPWQQYRPLIEVMITTDVIGSISLNRGTRLLPTYRTLLSRMNGLSAPEQYISMFEVMGCDNTSLLAIAETTALSEWRDRAEEMGRLSQKSLVKRGEAIEKLLSERAWRNGNASEISATIEEIEGEIIHSPDEWTKANLMAEVYYAAAHVYLATVVNGPFPKVPEVAAAVKYAVASLEKISDRYPRPDIYRKLVFPITITGAHCENIEQQEFFRDCLKRLGPEAAFGNTRSALVLMEEVWKKRRMYHPQVKVCWRQTMVELGWEAGLLLL